MSSISRNARRDVAVAVAPAPPDEDQTGWLLTFSDLVLQLFAFVLVVVVLASAAHPRAATTPARTPARFAALAQRIREMIRADGATDAVRVDLRDGGVVVTVSDAIAFAAGDDEVLPAAAPILRHVAETTQAMRDLTVVVEGHADDASAASDGSRSNVELAVARAAGVLRVIVGANAALVPRAVAAGSGETRLADGRRPERGRVEIKLVPDS